MNEEPTKRAKRFIESLGLPARGPRLAAPVGDWTGLPVDSDAPDRRRDIKPIGAAVGLLAERLGVSAPKAPAADGGEVVEEALLAAWSKAAGELAKRLVPEKYVGGILYVVGGNSAELFEIRRTKLRGIEAAARKLAPFAALRQIRIRAAG